MSQKPKHNDVRDTWPKDFRTIYVRHGVLTKEQLQTLISSFLNEAKKNAADPSSELHQYMDEINRSTWELNYILDVKTGLNLEKPSSFIRFSSSILFHLSLGNNPNGTPREKCIKNKDHPDYINSEIMHIEEFIEEQKKIRDRKRIEKERSKAKFAKTKKWADADSSDESEDDEDDDFEEEYERYLKDIHDNAEKMVMVTEEGLTPRIVDVAVPLNETQYNNLVQELINEAIAKGEEDMIQEIRTNPELKFGFIMAHAAHAKPPDPQFNRTTLQCSIFNENYDWITTSLIKEIFDPYNNDPNKSWPKVKISKSTNCTFITVEFSNVSKYINDACFCKYMKTKTVLKNPNNPDKDITLTFNYKRENDSQNHGNKKVDYKDQKKHTKTFNKEPQEVFLGSHFKWERVTKPSQSQNTQVSERKPLELIPRTSEIKSIVDPSRAWRSLIKKEEEIPVAETQSEKKSKKLPPPLIKTTKLSEIKEEDQEQTENAPENTVPIPVHSIKLLTFSFSGKPRKTYIDLENQVSSPNKVLKRTNSPKKELSLKEPPKKEEDDDGFVVQKKKSKTSKKKA